MELSFPCFILADTPLISVYYVSHLPLPASLFKPAGSCLYRPRQSGRFFSSPVKVLFGSPTPCTASTSISGLPYSLSYCYLQTIQGLRGSHNFLPYHAARKHLGATGELERLRPHIAGSTLPRLWPTGSSSELLPSITAWYFSSSPSDSASRQTPCPLILMYQPLRRYSQVWI